ncbi:MAG: hypothetical protein U5N56_11690 [Candidatus Marinimicrobia bacterium]|nr:hypothetical protein [Candidatus Neomarinimicrobiota bacterium]
MMKKILLTLWLLIFGITFLSAVDGTLNIIFTNSSVFSDDTGDYYEFDVQAYISDGTDDPYRFQDGMVYIEYNTSVFGTNIASSISVTKEGPLAKTIEPSAFYTLTNIENTESDICAITFEKNAEIDTSWYDSETYISTSESSPSTIMHIKMEFSSVGNVDVAWPSPEEDSLLNSTTIYTEIDGSNFEGFATSNTTSDDDTFLDGTGDPALPVTLSVLYRRI